MSERSELTKGEHPHGCRHSFVWTTSATGPFHPPEGHLTWCAGCGTWGRYEKGAWRAQQESPASMAIAQAEAFGDALSRIFAVLGPSGPNCEGCAHEIDEVLQIIREVHGV